MLQSSYSGGFGAGWEVPKDEVKDRVTAQPLSTMARLRTLRLWVKPGNVRGEQFSTGSPPKAHVWVVRCALPPLCEPG